MSSPRFLPAMLLAVLSLIWGSSFILMKFGLIAFSFDQVASLRLTLSMVVIFPFIVRYFPSTSKSDWYWLCLGGLIGNGIPAYIFPMAETVMPSAIAGVLNSLSPLFVLVTGWLIFKKTLPALKILGIFVGLGGAVMMALVSPSEKGDTTQVLIFGGAVIFATFLYGLSTNLSAYKLKHLPPVQIAGVAFLFCGIPSAIWLFGVTDFVQVMQVHPEAWKSFAAVATLSVVGSALALVLYYQLLQLAGPASAASVTYLMPIVALGWGILDHEKLGVLHLVGMVVIVGGVYLVNRKR
jgi:drug/metabolite transporter (DMT)-like permease